MGLTPLPSSIGRGLNPLPFNRKPSTLPLDHSFYLWGFGFKLELIFTTSPAASRYDGNPTQLTSSTIFHIICNIIYPEQFGQAKFASVGLILGSSQFALLPQLTLKMMHSLKEVKLTQK